MDSGVFIISLAGAAKINLIQNFRSLFDKFLVYLDGFEIINHLLLGYSKNVHQRLHLTKIKLDFMPILLYCVDIIIKL